MSMHCRMWPLALLVFTGVCGFVAAQRNPSGLPSPRLYQLSPCGARAGSTVEVVVAGKHLEEPERLVFSHPGIKAEFVPPPPPPVDPKTKKPKQAMPNAPAPELFTFKVTVPPNTPLGFHDVRVVNRWGVSNPRLFVVGDLPEVAEKEPNNDVEQSQRVEVNTTINGTIANPTDVDYFTFSAKKGQRVVVSCLTSSIDSRLQPQIELYDSRDRQLASNRTYSAYDAVMDFTAPADGDYQLRVFQFTHTFRGPIPGNMPNGSSDYFYRLTISTAPWIDAVNPSVVEAGKTTPVTVYGRNLPGGVVDPNAVADDSVLEKVVVQVTAPADGRGKLTFSGPVPPSRGWLDGFELRVRNGVGSSNPFLLGIARAPIVLDAGNNDTPQTAQEVNLPCEIAGSVEKRRDRDWYRFNAKKGETWNIEVISNQLGAPTYMMILVRNPANNSEIYESPLNENPNQYSQKFFSRSEDPPIYRFTAPADGKYELLVASRAGDTLYGARHTYAVRITRDDQDYRLVALAACDENPDTVILPAGGQQAFSVLVHRTEGFTGDVALSIEGLPPGVTCPPQTVHGAVKQTTFVVSAAEGAAPWAGEIKIKGVSVLHGAKVVREARSAGITWPIQPNQNTPTISRLESGLWLSVRGKAPFALAPTIDKAELVQGDKANVKVKIVRSWPDLKNPVQVGLMQSQNRQGVELPQNLRFGNNQPVNINANQAEVSLPVTVGNDVPPGVYNIVFRGQTQAPYAKDATTKTRPNTFLVQPSAPLTVTVLPKSLAQLSLSANSANVKIGAQTELVVRVRRQFDYKGEFKVQLVLPPGVTGVQAGEVTIPAGADEAKLVLKVPAGVNLGGRNNLVVRATALFNGKTPTVHETKLNVNVVK